MQQEQPGIGPYPSWPPEEHARWIRAGNTFGRHVMSAALAYAKGRIPRELPPAERAAAEKAAADAVYGMMMLLDGVAASDIDAEHVAGYVLQLQVFRRGSAAPVETFELAPDGDGLCMGFHGWLAGDAG